MWISESAPKLACTLTINMDLEILLLGEFSLGAASTGPRQQMFRIYKWSGAQGDRGLSQLREMGTKLNA